MLGKHSERDRVGSGTLHWDWYGTDPAFQERPGPVIFTIRSRSVKIKWPLLKKLVLHLVVTKAVIHHFSAPSFPVDFKPKLLEAFIVLRWHIFDPYILYVYNATAPAEFVWTWWWRPVIWRAYAWVRGFIYSGRGQTQGPTENRALIISVITGMSCERDRERDRDG